MKQKIKCTIMNRSWNLLFILIVFGQTACNAQPQKVAGKSFSPNESVSKLWGDTVCDILFAPSKVNCYTLKVQDKNDEKQKRITNDFSLDKNVGIVEKNYYPVLQFLLQDSTNYQFEPKAINKCFFEPYLAFEFVKGKEKAYVLIAFNCECWGVVYKDKLTVCPYLCHRKLLRFAHGILPGDKYINKLLTY